MNLNVTIGKYKMSDTDENDVFSDKYNFEIDVVILLNISRFFILAHFYTK